MPKAQPLGAVFDVEQGTFLDADRETLGAIPQKIWVYGRGTAVSAQCAAQVLHAPHSHHASGGAQMRLKADAVKPRGQDYPPEAMTDQGHPEVFACYAPVKQQKWCFD